MTEILHILQVGVQKTHQFDHCIGIGLTAFRILNRHHVFNHPLHMAAIFPHGEVISGSIIFHEK